LGRKGLARDSVPGVVLSGQNATRQTDDTSPSAADVAGAQMNARSRRKASAVVRESNNSPPAPAPPVPDVVGPSPPSGGTILPRALLSDPQGAGSVLVGGRDGSHVTGPISGVPSRRSGPEILHNRGEGVEKHGETAYSVHKGVGETVEEGVLGVGGVGGEADADGVREGVGPGVRDGGVVSEAVAAGVAIVPADGREVGRSVLGPIMEGEPMTPRGVVPSLRRTRMKARKAFYDRIQIAADIADNPLASDMARIRAIEVLGRFGPGQADEKAEGKAPVQVYVMAAPGSTVRVGK
jgi:hypothetical protein